VVDRLVFVPSAALGILLIAVYGAQCWRNGTTFNVAVLVNLILQAAGVVGGSLISISTFYEPLRQRLTGLDLYVLISGLVVVSVSIQGLLRDLLGDAKRKALPRDSS